MKKEHLENLISFARGIKGIGVKYMDFKVFDTTRLMSILNEQKNNGDKPLSTRSLKRKQRTGQKMMKLPLQMSLCNYLLNSDK